MHREIAIHAEHGGLKCEGENDIVQICNVNKPCNDTKGLYLKRQINNMEYILRTKYSHCFK